MVKIFITGATGYIGGDFLYVVSQARPDWGVTCLIRSASKAAQLASAYPSVRIVEGDLDDVSIIEREASNADIVLHFAHSDHIKSAQAIARGLASTGRENCFWIHTSGAGILTHENFSHNKFGQALPSDSKIYDDWAHVGELTSLPDRALHRHVDKIVLSASLEKPVKTAIVAPSCIYGIGRGPCNQSSVQVHVATQVALQAKRSLQIGDGSSIWHEVHIHDLSQLYLLLAEAAAAGGGRATWNDQGYYLAENGSFLWGDIMQRIADEAFKRGLLESNKVQGVDMQVALSHHRYFPYLCGTTSRGVARRARELLQWRPCGSPMVDEIPAIVEYEASRLSQASSSKL